ncbi:uncharacterized protein NPIL_107841 [Nephila pilipes]|uniref:Uncharacterized protein n=1 Tax=Nephila pilipes TaxID=299642 RepID=A0A8X6QPV6_NEPPI|nr:uncharacterized protein NPIL_107841 [Nephila pilipes]
MGGSKLVWMFSSIALVLNGKVKMQLRFGKMWKVRKPLVPKVKVIDQAYGMLFSGVKSALDVGNTVCIQMPKRAVVLCFTIQKEIFFMPFRLLNKVYEAIFQPPLKFLYRIYAALTREDPTPVELLTGEKNPSPSKIIESSRKLRSSVLTAIHKENNARSQISMYQKQLEKWKLENEKRTEEIYKISLEEKELMKAVASALRYLKSLKMKREKMNESFSKNVSHMINTGTLSEEKLLAMQKEIKNVDAAINEKKNACLNLLSQGRATNEDVLGFKQAAASTTFAQHAAKLETCQAMNQTDAMHKVLSVVMDENLYLKNRLCSTHDKLEEILKLSENINNEIVNFSQRISKMITVNNEMANLQHKLDHERELLKSVEAERDQMRDKLMILENMIKDEEEFLGASDSGIMDECFLFNYDYTDQGGESSA